MKKNIIHKPVLVEEVLTYIKPQPGKLYLDATFGSGGHTQAILEAEPTCHVIALDWDTQALENFGEPLKEQYGDRLELVWSNFANLYKVMHKNKINGVDGILADFGTSQVQLAEKAGFSFNTDTPLDMRMAPSYQKVTAAELLNKASESKLADIFFQLGEERAARSIARAVINERQKHSFRTTRQLAELMEKLVPVFRRKQGIHPATKVFQALRIFVNHELENIQSFLPAAMRALHPEGRLVCISFHSLEDRLVKQFFNEQARNQLAHLLTKHAIVATPEEIQRNASSRSAKLRALQIMNF